MLPEVPAILISGYADDQALADAPPGVAVLRKPFTLGQMGEAIGALTARRLGPCVGKPTSSLRTRN